MTLNRMGSTRRPTNRKAWLTGTLTLGALAATGGVASAALAHSSDGTGTKVAPVSQNVQGQGAEHDKDGDHEGREGHRGPVCLRLDKKARKAIADAPTKADGSVVVPMDKDNVKVVPCPKPTKPGTPTQAPTKPGTPTQAPSKPAPSQPAPTQPPAPTQKPTPTPTVTSTAS